MLKSIILITIALQIDFRNAPKGGLQEEKSQAQYP